MKLRMICENIRKTEFYDFYALAYVYQELQTSTGVDPAYRKEVEYTLRDLAKYILTDHITQLTTHIAGRLLNDVDHQAICDQYGIPIPDPDGLNTEQFKDNIRKLSLTQQANFLREIASSRTQWQTGAGMGGIWHKHAATVARLASTNINDTNALVLAIDYIYGMAHHGGQITDHMDESGWLESALNTRTLTSPRNLLFHASPHIRELLTSASIGVPKHEKVSLLQELEVILARLAKSNQLFDYSYEIGEELNEFTFSLKLRRATKEPSVGRAYKLESWKMADYYKWGELYNHDYSQDKECVQTIYGLLTGKRQAGPPPTFTSKILLFDKDGQKISKKQASWDRELGEITTPQGPIRSTERFAKTMPSVATVAHNLVDSAANYQETDEIDWHPIQGDPNPNS